MKKILLLMLCMVLLVGSASALDNLGTFKQGETINISQVCSDATYITISSVSYPNSTKAITNVNMTSSGSGEFYYDFNLTSNIGRYDVRGISDGCEETFATYFEITQTGFGSTNNIGIWILLLLAVLMFAGFLTTGKEKEETDEIGNIIGIKNRRPAKWTFFLLFILFLALGFNVAFISIYNEIGDTGTGAIYDTLAAVSVRVFWFAFGILIVMWVLITIASLSSRKKMREAEATGNPTNFK